MATQQTVEALLKNAEEAERSERFRGVHMSRTGGLPILTGLFLHLGGERIKYMLMSRKYKFIFIHIYKNAGSSVTNALLPFAANKLQRMSLSVLKKLNISRAFEPEPFPAHIKASELVNAIGKEAFESFFSFAIVRNPWDWQVSLYNYALTNINHYQHDLVKGLGSFNEYIGWRCSEEVRFQKDFIYSVDGELLVDFVGKFENINADFDTICSRIGVSASLPKLNVSNVSNVKPYQQYYNENTRELLRRTFAADILLFGYDF